MKTTHSMRFFEPDTGTTPAGAPPAAAPAAPPDAPGSLLGSNDAGVTPPAEPAQPWINPDGAFTEGWTSRLPDDLKDAAPTLGKYKTVADLAKALHNANGLIGKKTLVPNEKSTPEEISAFRQAIGVPEKLEEYDIKPSEIPEGLGWNEDNARKYAELGHKHNIPPAAMKAIVAEYANQRIAEMQIMAQEVDSRRQAGAADLKKTWGDDFDKNLGIAKQAAQIAGANPESFGFGDPEVVKAFVRLASQLSDDKLTAGNAGGTMQGGKTRAQDIMTNKNNPLFEKYQNGDPDTVDMVRRFLKQG